MRSLSALKFVAGLAATILLRLVQAVPNVEPIMGIGLPYSKAFGAVAGFAFAFLSLVSFDFISGRLGLWTVYCGLAYGAIGFFAANYLRSKNGRMHYAAYSFTATIAYDAVTAFLFGLQFNQPLAVTFVGQVPFTLYHLIGNVSLSAIISPLIYAHFLAEPETRVAKNVVETVH